MEDQNFLKSNKKTIFVAASVGAFLSPLGLLVLDKLSRTIGAGQEGQFLPNVFAGISVLIGVPTMAIRNLTGFPISPFAVVSVIGACIGASGVIVIKFWKTRL